MNHRQLAAALALLLAVAPAGLRAQDNLELGKMWTFEAPPLAYLEREYGFKPTQEWLDLVRLSSLRFGQGCSASFVSPRGLILTNHHCVRGDIARNQGGENLLEGGFAAADYGDEIKLEGLTVQQLVAMRDVTAEIEAGVQPGDDAAVEQQRLDNEERVLEAASREHGDLQHQVVKLFQGAVYQLYSYKVWEDIRLVCAPHLQTAHFGGDPDNFTFPRYCIDFAFCRAYENDRPADTSAHYFRWSAPGAREGDLVFVTGNPGSTERLLTKAQLEYLRDAQYPRIRAVIEERLGALRARAAKDPDTGKAARADILNLENAQKAYGGMHAALLDPAFMAHKERAEGAFRAKIEAEPGLRARYGDVWDQLAEVARQRAALETPMAFHAPGGSRHIAKALMLVQAAQNGRPEPLRRAKEMAVAMNPAQAEAFVDHFTRAQRALPADDPYLQAVLGGRTPREAHEHLSGHSRVGDAAFVDELIAGGGEALAASEDPALAAARVLAPLVEQHMRAAAELDTKENVLGTRLGLALFAAYGKSVSPDATFTLRFSDGVVKGYPCNGTLAPWRTTFFGLYARNIEFGDQPPFDLPAPWLERKAEIELGKSLDFVCTCDSTGGNSGSPVINRERELVGLLFDGNIESLGNQFIFRDDVPRSVCVHTEAIAQALQKVYGAGRVLAELAGAER